MAIVKTGGFVINIATYIAVRGWGDSWRDVLAVAKTKNNWITVLTVFTAETEGGGGENFVILAVTVITAKKRGLLAKNVAKEKDKGNKNVENDPFWPNRI